MKKGLIFLIGFLVGLSSCLTYFYLREKFDLESTLTIENSLPQVNLTPYEKYYFDNLSKEAEMSGTINIGDVQRKLDEFSSFLFELRFKPEINGLLSKKTTGLINIPEGEGKFPAIIMIRGYVDQEVYTIGMGTSKAGEFFAQNDFITVAPDFLGYGGSDSESGNIFESRFQTYVTVISLLNSLNDISKWDGENVFFWAHSNGGQIGLSVLSITGKNIPTTLWAPVTKPFPYNILYYTDESEDGGALIRKELYMLEEKYDLNKFSFTNYLSQINAPLMIHQGTGDDAVPEVWNLGFSNKLKKLEKDITYFSYPGMDHNMKPFWDSVIVRDLDFFQKHMQN